MTAPDKFKERVPWNADGDVDILDEEEEVKYYPRLPGQIDIIPHTYGSIHGGREHPDPDGEFSAVPNSDGTYSYDGCLWSPREGDLIPIKPEKKQPEVSYARLGQQPGQPDLEALRQIRDSIDEILKRHGG